MPAAPRSHAVAALAATLLALDGTFAADSFAEQAGLAADDECSADMSGAAGGGQCALNALQRQSESLSARSSAAAAAVAEDDSSELSNQTREAGRIWHYARNCWRPCNGAGMCEDYCGPGNACCRYLHSSDPPECSGVRFWPVLSFHTCVHSPWGNGAGKTGAEQLIYTKPSLYEPSKAPLMEFYMYRVHSNETYDPENQNLANPGGAMWYLHNEIVYHSNMKRSGTYFSVSKTRVERFRIKAKATQPLYELGMNFGVVNTFDSTKCTGPYSCYNFRKYGFTVGCETWNKTLPETNFPHSQWVGKNQYPGATWYSLPGPCPSKSLGEKTQSCEIEEPGGACPNSDDITGEGNCTYSYEKMGEISIDELEGITDPKRFVANGGQEYDVDTDRGVHNHFWDRKGDPHANQWRIDRFLALFKEKYPQQPDLQEPTCDFNKKKFFPGRYWR